MRVRREDLLQSLEAVQSGVEKREVIEQSSCFAFKDGMVFTYNDEVACQSKSGLPKSLKGAVQAPPLLTLLRKLPEDEIDIDVSDGNFVVTGKRRKAGVRMEADILMPLENLETPSEWKKLHEDFTDAINMTVQCVGQDKDSHWSFVHIHPKHIEACDNFQMTRYKLPTGVKSDILVRGDSIRHVASVDMTEFSETAAWAHFRNPAGLVISCRRFIEDYEDLTPFLSIKGGTKTQFPKGINEAVEKAEIFSSENVDDNKVMVKLSKGRLRIKGQGASGWYWEVKNVEYEGPKLQFMITPKLLVDITQKHNECELTDQMLKIGGGKWTYVARLTKVEEVEEGGGE